MQIFFVCLHFGVLAYCQAQEDEVRPSSSMKLSVPLPKQNEDISAGVVVDQSATFIGQNFYRAFVQSWSELDTEERYTITLKERPTARYGSFIMIEYQGRPTFNTQLSPVSMANTKSIAEMAAGQVFNTIRMIEMSKLLDRDVDLGSDEL